MTLALFFGIRADTTKPWPTSKPCKNFSTKVGCHIVKNTNFTLYRQQRSPYIQTTSIKTAWRRPTCRISFVWRLKMAKNKSSKNCEIIAFCLCLCGMRAKSVSLLVAFSNKLIYLFSKKMSTVGHKSKTKNKSRRTKLTSFSQESHEHPSLKVIFCRVYWV